MEQLLGCGVRDTCDPDACRFDRVVLCVDADPDGYNIAASLIATFVSNFRPLVESGMLYVAMPPLFIVSAGTLRRYCLDEHERDAAVAELREQGKKPMVQRCKGLGEMRAEDFRETVMDPSRRTLIQVTYDPQRDDPTLETVFAATPEARREWMADHAAAVDADEIMA